MINQAKHIRFIFPLRVMFLKQLIELFDAGCYEEQATNVS